MSYKRVCRDCPVPDCGAKYLVKLSNHLADVHGLSCDERRMWLQECKRQPIIKVVNYHCNDQQTEEPCTPLQRRFENEDHYFKPIVERKRQSKESSRKLRWVPLPY